VTIYANASPHNYRWLKKIGVRLHICIETFSWKYVSDNSDDLPEGGFGIEQRGMQNITDTQQTTAKAGTQY